jgi:hypothetical protein
MLKNNEEKKMKKMIRVTLLALLCSLVSAFYLSMVQESDKVADEITQPD